MKKYLSLLTISTLSTSVLPTVGMVLNSNVVKNLSLKDSPPVNDNQIINRLKTNIPNWINKLSITHDDIIFAGSLNGLYKSTDISGTWFTNVLQKSINNIAISGDGTIWVACGDGVFKCLAGQTTFKAMAGTSGEITQIVVGKDNNIYAVRGDLGLYKSILYKSIDGKEQFLQTGWNENNGCITSLITDKGGTIWVGTYQNALWKSTDGQTFNKITEISSNSNVTCVFLLSNRTILVGTYQNGLYKSTDGINFNQIKAIGKEIYSLAIDKYKNIYVGSNNSTVYKIHLLDNLLKVNNPNYYGPKYNGFVYNKEQAIDLKEKYLKAATLDGQSLTIPSTNVPIKPGSGSGYTNGQHSLVLTFNNKDNCNQYLDLFGGNTNTGVITYNFWIKTSIDSNTEFNYSTKPDDTDLLTGLISNAGNTKG